MIFLFRLYSWLYRHHVPLLPRLLYGLNRILFAVVLPPSVDIGKDVRFAYSGLGTVVHARARIGNHVMIGPNVTIGGRSGLPDVPVIEDGANIGAGACVLGPVVVGQNAVVGACAVVLHDVPAESLAVGVPATLKHTAMRAARTPTGA